MTRILDAKYISDYKIEVSFDDAKAGCADLSSIFLNDTRPLISELRNSENFSKFSVSSNAISWDNGVDISPEYLSSLVR